MAADTFPPAIHAILGLAGIHDAGAFVTTDRTGDLRRHRLGALEQGTRPINRHR